MVTDLGNFPTFLNVHRRPIARYDYDLPHCQSVAEPMMEEFLSAPIEPNREEVQSLAQYPTSNADTGGKSGIYSG